jgi:hypothetical protein
VNHGKLKVLGALGRPRKWNPATAEAVD